MERKMITGTATIHTVYVAQCWSELEGNFTRIFTRSCVEYYKKLLGEMGNSATIEEALSFAADHAKILSYSIEQRYCCCIKDPDTLAARCDIITSWVNHENLPFTAENIKKAGYAGLSFLKKSKIVEAVNAEKIVAIDGLGVIDKFDLDKIKEI